MDYYILSGPIVSSPLLTRICSCLRCDTTDYMVQHLGIPVDEVEQLTQHLYYTYGTTMAGLAAKGHQLDFDHYHAHVHATLDYQNMLSVQPETRKTLADLTLQKHILTNADAKHTAACLERMGLTDCFQVSRLAAVSKTVQLHGGLGKWRSW